MAGKYLPQVRTTNYPALPERCVAEAAGALSFSRIEQALAGVQVVP